MKIRIALLLLTAFAAKSGIAQIEVTGGGNVGVGTSSPAGKLDVVAGSGRTVRIGQVSGYTMPADFGTGGAYLGLSRPSDGGVVNGLFTYDSPGGSNNLGVTSRSDIVFLAGLSGMGGAPERMRILDNGNVGIGTRSPASVLSLYSGDSYHAPLLVNRGYDGARIQMTYGAGTTPTELGMTYYGAGRVALWLGANLNSTGASHTTPLQENVTQPSWLAVLDTANDNFEVRRIPAGGSSSSLFRIVASGNVGVGVATPSQKLEVAGSVRATSFISNSTTYADFVFEPGYKLPALSEVEAHIKAHGHLPDIPSEAEAKEHGIDLAAMQVKLLQKIEELTLHQIAQEKEIAALKRQLNRQ